MTKLALLAVLIVAVVVAEYVWGWSGVSVLRERVEAAGPLGAVAFVVGYAALCLLPAPKSVLTALGGLLFGLWWGALLAWVGAMVGAVAGFWLGRLLGREAVDRLLRGRLERADRLLSEHGLGAVVTARLIPVLPYTGLNYSAGLTGVRFRDYVVGTALGMVPGSLAYAALGAWGTSPWGLFAALAALVLLIVVGGLVGRRLLARKPGDVPVPEEG